jgi:hypothetical protein
MFPQIDTTGSFEHIVELQQRIDITFHGVLLLYESSLPIYFTAADSQLNF